MRLVFLQSCSCKLPRESLPKPSIKTIHTPDVTSGAAQAEIDINLSCHHCGAKYLTTVSDRQPFVTVKRTELPKAIDLLKKASQS